TTTLNSARGFAKITGWWALGHSERVDADSFSYKRVIFMRCGGTSWNHDSRGCRPELRRSESTHGLITIIALALALAPPSHPFAQTTLSLGQAAQYGIFQMSNGTSLGARLSLSNTRVSGSAALGQSTQYQFRGANVSGTAFKDSSGTVS